MYENNAANGFGQAMHDTAPRCARAIDLAGVPQIPDDVFRDIERGWEFALSADQIARADAIIWKAATKVIQARHREAKLAGVEEQDWQSSARVKP